jgi:hypothetical protein
MLTVQWIAGKSKTVPLYHITEKMHHELSTNVTPYIYAA